MPNLPTKPRCIAFIDGQNLFYAVKKAFGYPYPNYEPKKLAEIISAQQGWDLQQTYFYTGIPDKSDDVFWNRFWAAKLAVMGTRGIKTFTRTLRYRHQTLLLPDGTPTTVMVGQEKGIDVRIALDIVRLAHKNLYDVALIFSQDQDLSEAADEVKVISIERNRWIKVACVFPISPTYKNSRGINNTQWIEFNHKTYEQCIDPINYKLKNLTE